MRAGRRQLLRLGTAGALLGLGGGTARAVTDEDGLERAVAAFAAGARPARTNALTLTTPEVAENGHSVGVSVSVASPMSESDHVEAIALLAPANPNLVVATFRFTAASATARVATRIRLAETQSLVAVARTSGGELHRVANPVRVVVGGCSA